ncbi:MAG: hypothetical protein EB101_12725 [Chitinophagia bacterium]|nr:hypothetical protein [Chitinophagia bacterium]
MSRREAPLIQFFLAPGCSCSCFLLFELELDVIFFRQRVSSTAFLFPLETAGQTTPQGGHFFLLHALAACEAFCQKFLKRGCFFFSYN